MCPCVMLGVSSIDRLIGHTDNKYNTRLMQYANAFIYAIRMPYTCAGFNNAHCSGAHSGFLALSEEAEIKVPDQPVANRGPELQRGSQECAEKKFLYRVPLVHGLLGDRVPCSVFHQPVSWHTCKHIASGGSALSMCFTELASSDCCIARWLCRPALRGGT